MSGGYQNERWNNCFSLCLCSFLFRYSRSQEASIAFKLSRWVKHVVKITSPYLEGSSWRPQVLVFEMQLGYVLSWR